LVTGVEGTDKHIAWLRRLTDILVDINQTLPDAAQNVLGKCIAAASKHNGIKSINPAALQIVQEGNRILRAIEASDAA